MGTKTSLTSETTSICGWASDGYAVSAWLQGETLKNVCGMGGYRLSDGNTYHEAVEMDRLVECDDANLLQ